MLGSILPVVLEHAENANIRINCVVPMTPNFIDGRRFTITSIFGLTTWLDAWSVSKLKHDVDYPIFLCRSELEPALLKHFQHRCVFGQNICNQVL
jgi:hypothetical protein